MPGFDGTGPRGQGPITGRGMGYCAVPVSGLASARGAVAPLATPYYPAMAMLPGAVPYGIPGAGYARFGRYLRFGYGRGYGRGFGRRGGRGRRY